MTAPSDCRRVSAGRSANGGLRLSGAALLLVLFGSTLAYCVQSAGGIRLLDVRFAGTGGAPMSALLYIPRNATAKTPAPGILAVHGYFNSREAQDGFAIELARRGFVVLALDQPGHGFSAPPAFANHFGGPDGLAYLRSLDVVDNTNIGLEGHSMGGWAVVDAAAAYPHGYRAVVLEGSSTGAPFAPEGTPAFPRNLAVVYSRLDEFSQTMWGVETAAEVTQSRKLWRVFGTDGVIVPDRVYGDVANGTARVLFTPPGTHPMDHISPAAIGDAIDWFQRTLHGGTPKPAADQIWYWKEIGTLIALAGFVALLLGVFDFILTLPYFAPLAAAPAPCGLARDGRWWLTFLLGTTLPVITLLPFFGLGGRLLPASHWLPQAFTNELVTWAVLNALLLIALSLLPTRFSTTNASPAARTLQPRRAMLAALWTIGIGYLVAVAAEFFFKIDFRIWFIAVRPMSLWQMRAFLIYLLPITFYFVIALRALHGRLAVRSDSVSAQYLCNIAALVAGMVAFLAIEYGSLAADHHLLTLQPTDALRVIIAINFVPLLSIAAVISTFAYRRTGSTLPGALICGLLVTWYVVVNQATQAT